MRGAFWLTYIMSAVREKDSTRARDTNACKGNHNIWWVQGPLVTSEAQRSIRNQDKANMRIAGARSRKPVNEYSAPRTSINF
jgi:hypothetical protein